MKGKLKIYIASPYTHGDTAKNIRRQIDAADILLEMGHVPFIPLLTHFQHMVHPRHENEWLDWDLEWLRSCDAVVRIKPLTDHGHEIPSSGADLEEATARENGMPVYIVSTPEEIKDLKI